MANTGHYLKPGKGATSPGIVISIACDTDDAECRRSTFYRQRRFLSGVATYTRRRGKQWSIPQVFETDDAKTLLQWVWEKANYRRRNYVICPIASDVLTLTEWWKHAEKRGIFLERGSKDDNSGNIPSDDCNCIIVRRCILRGKPDILDFLDYNKRFVYLSGIQYFAGNENAIAEAIGFKPTMDLTNISSDEDRRYSARDRAILWSQLLCQLATWWTENSTAPFGLTLGSLSMGVLRSYVKAKTLSTHKDEYASKLERIACYGGRASVWYVGNIGSPPIASHHWNTGNGQCVIPSITGPARLIDVRSMYPFLLANRTFPARYCKRTGEISTADLLGVMSHFGVIAKVDMWADNPEYPYRQGNRITYPRGYIQTVLTSPEIEAFTGKDKILKVHDALLYYMGTPYKEAAQALLDMRINARNERRASWEMFAKALGNNLGGKLAQRRGMWKPRPDVIPEVQWGEWIRVNVDTKTTTRYMARAGMVWEYLKDDGAYGPYTASFAFLTAYGRLLMRNLRQKLPPFSVVSQDTDGLWIVGNDAYNASTQAYSFGNSPGELQVKYCVDNAVFLGPRHYWTDCGWTLAGFHNHSVDNLKLLVTDTYSFNPILSGVREAPTELITKQRISALQVDHAGGEVSPDGWVFPLYRFPPKGIEIDY